MHLLPSFILLSTLLPSESYKILVYNSRFGHSHSLFLGRIADILVDAGHNVVVLRVNFVVTTQEFIQTSLLPIVNSAVGDGTEKSLKIHVQPHPEVKEYYEKQQSHNFFTSAKFNPLVPFRVGTVFARNFERTCKKVIEEPGLIERLRAEKYDVMITENFDVCGIGISHAIAPKAVIGSSSTFLFGWQFDEFGVENAVSYRPNLISSNLDVHSMVSRFWNVYAEMTIRTTFWFKRRAVNRVLKEHFGSDYPTIYEQSSNVAFVLTNSEPLIESAAPTTARVINVPGIGAKDAKPLDQYWEGVLTRRDRTVLLSFGSFARSTQLPEMSKRGILRAIARFPDTTFIWKYEDLEDEFAKEASAVENLVLTKWMPQVDILNHKNLVLFITHGGMGSTREAALRGVPGLFIPIFFDQPRNAGMAEFNGLGKVYDKFELHGDEKLAEIIKEVLEDKTYRENAQRLSKMLAKKPFTSKEILIRHVEFAAEFGPSAALRPQSLDMSIVEYHNLDLIAIALVVSLLSFYAVAKLLIRVFSTFVSVKRTKVE